MSKFEVAKGYENAGINLPKRATAGSAGYDFEAAEDIVIPSFWFNTPAAMLWQEPMELNQELTKIIKKAGNQPTLVPTGVKCKLDAGQYLKLVSRSSSPLKYLLILANGEGIIDLDYYGNASNDGHIYFQFINLSPCPIQIRKGDKIGQGIICRYETVEDDSASETRTGGFGSTNT